MMIIRQHTRTQKHFERETIKAECAELALGTGSLFNFRLGTLCNAITDRD